jgi:outer membrane protein
MKKFILSLMLLLPLSMAAQDVKIAVVDFNGIVTVMPEVNALESQLMALQQRYQSELQSLENDFNRKQSDYISQQDSLNENIKIMRMQEIEDIRMRMEN